MTKLPHLSGKAVVKVRSKSGFNVVRRKGSHVILIKQAPDGQKAVVVPMHKEIDLGTLIEIIRQSGLKREEFLKIV